jgi:hypothetical protein
MNIVLFNVYLVCLGIDIINTGLIISFLTIVAMVLASRYVYLTTKVFQKIKTDGVHGVFSVRFNESDDTGGGSRRSVAYFHSSHLS